MKPYSISLYPGIKRQGAYVPFILHVDAGMLTTMLLTTASALLEVFDPRSSRYVSPGKDDEVDKDFKKRHTVPMFPRLRDLTYFNMMQNVQLLQEYVDFRNADPTSNVVNDFLRGELEMIVYHALVHYHNWRIECAKQPGAPSLELREINKGVESLVDWPNKFAFGASVLPTRISQLY